MKYNRLGYLVGEGFSNVFKNKKSTGASLMIMCATMIIFGIFLILGENINARKKVTLSYMLSLIANIIRLQGFYELVNDIK